jgi:Tfp pilus assembly protein PilF
MVRTSRFLLLYSLLVVGAASAQDWRGTATMSGKVTDQAGKPVEGGLVRLIFVESKAGTEVTTTNKGQWEVKGIANGNWVVQITKDGFDPTEFPVEVGGKIKNPRIESKLWPAGSDPNIALTTGDKKARELIAQQKFAEARAIYEDLFAKYPKVFQLHVSIAQTYDKQNQFEQAADQLKKYLENDPQNTQIRGFLGVELASAGRADEAFEVLTSIQPAQMKDAADLKDCGFTLLRQKKPADAVKFFELAVTRFPDDAAGYYYRGISELQLVDPAPTADAAEKKVHLDKARADLSKFITMAPDAAEAATAKKVLEQIK